MAGMSGIGSSSPHPSVRDEVEWQRRAEERARQQAEQFRREQERVEREREVKLVELTGKGSTRKRWSVLG